MTKKLDVAFALDCTASMGPYIDQAKANINKIVDEIVAMQSCDVKLALVEYRDHPPQDRSFITRVTDLTDVKSLKKALAKSDSQGGGDEPEAVADALYESLNLSWRKDAAHIVVLILDAPPHGLQQNDTFSAGCPAGHDPVKISQKMAEKGITLYCAGCEPSCLKFKEFLEMLAFNTGGRYLPMAAANLLPKIITGAALEEISMEAWLKDVAEEVAKQEALGVDTSAPDFYADMGSKLKARGAVGFQTKAGATKLAPVSAQAREISKSAVSMDTFKSLIKSTPVPTSSAAPPPPSSGAMGDYVVEEEAFDDAQVERMVMKTKARKY